MEDLTGRAFGPYRIVAPLGEGGMASVYKAYQPAVERHVALKILPSHLARNATLLPAIAALASIWPMPTPKQTTAAWSWRVSG
ncbi:MAG: hypothetical protein QGF21_05845 [Vicinamibacterales bacterium]|jgi:serine/threonine protein kinase|nr:hypothetical protein [Acidobacteriota bacterium]MDP7472810.1 hypothetical protein [Vicinamibacterales bacterium]MDP7671452.1 hypothetical protein [Vicinamibacterales bacterium]HJO38926.1 hypothetical protein [Vicinamibacterales bacterium]|tara:strand:+ start:3215 stop:3463 length:249 start_codon:yes stop_codon:yes gene_type:complete